MLKTWQFLANCRTVVLNQAGLLQRSELARPCGSAQTYSISHEVRRTDILGGLECQEDGDPLDEHDGRDRMGSMPKIEVTPEELLSMPDSGHYELIDGELKERNVSVLSSLRRARRSSANWRSCRAHNWDRFCPPDSVTAVFLGNLVACGGPTSRSSGRIA